MLHVLQVDSQRGVDYETNVLHVWIQFHGTLRACKVHITAYDITTWSWVNSVNPLQQRWTCHLLCGSAPLSCPSTLKLASLPLASVASLCLALCAWLPPPLSKLLQSQVQGLCGGMAAQERSQHLQKH